VRTDLDTPAGAPGPGATTGFDGEGPPSGHPTRRRRWPYVLVALLLLLGLLVVALVVTTDRAHQVTLGQAEQRLGPQARAVPGSRPAPGVYDYRGTGSEHLSLPPLSQSEGPTIPGTVTLDGADCFVFRVDYSSHHWETWRYCLRHGNLEEAGGKTWQLWSIGPVDVTDVADFHCRPATMAVPAPRAPGQVWSSRCTGTNTSVAGTTVSAGPYRFLGDVSVRVGTTKVEAAHFLRLRTDSGAQQGFERSQVWFDLTNGLPLRESETIEVRTATPFGTSTYTQTSSFSLVSLHVRR